MFLSFCLFHCILCSLSFWIYSRTYQTERKTCKSDFVIEMYRLCLDNIFTFVFVSHQTSYKSEPKYCISTAKLSSLRLYVLNWYSFRWIHRQALVSIKWRSKVDSRLDMKWPIIYTLRMIRNSKRTFTCNVNTNTHQFVAGTENSFSLRKQSNK